MRPGPVGIAGVVVAMLVLGYVLFGGSTDNGVGSTIRDRLASAGLTGQDCPLRFGATAGEPAGVTAVLLDRSASTRGATDAPDYAAALAGEVEKAVGRGDTLVIAGFDGGTAPVRWSVTETAFAGDPNRADAARDDTRECARQRIADAARGRPAAPDSDVLGALLAAQAPLAAAPAGHRSLLLATDGLVNTGCANLNDRVSEGDNLTGIAEKCGKELASLPDTAVTVLAVGDAAARPNERQVQWLGTLWSALCAKITDATCSVATSALPVRIVNPAPTGSAASDQPIVWPVVEEKQTGNLLVVTLPNRLLFDTASDRLRPGAEQSLSSVADTVAESRGRSSRSSGTPTAAVNRSTTTCSRSAGPSRWPTRSAPVTACPGHRAGPVKVTRSAPRRRARTAAPTRSRCSATAGWRS